MSNLSNIFGNNSTPAQLPTGYSPSGNANINSIYGNALQNYQNLFNANASMYNNIGDNQNGYVASVVNPAIQSNAQQYGDLVQNQAQRGIYGSSFGNQDLSNFQNAANTNVANLTGNALQQSLGMQSGVLGNMGNLTQGIGNLGGSYGGYLNTGVGQGLAYNSQANAQALQNAGMNSGMFGNLMNGLSQMFGGNQNNSGWTNWGNMLGGLFGGSSGSVPVSFANTGSGSIFSGMGSLTF